MRTKKCAIMTQYFGKNYGSILTAFALQKLLDNLGYYNELIQVHKPFGYSYNFSKKYLRTTFQCLNSADFEKLNQEFDTFILGSDNQMDYEKIQTLIYRYLFNYTDINKKRIIIAGSCGNSNEKSTNFDIEKVSTLMRTMDYISFREEKGKRLCKKFFDIDSDWILDPVFMIDKGIYLNMAKKVKPKNKKFVMTYILYSNENKEMIIDYIRKDKKLPIINFLGNEKAKHFSIFNNQSVEMWLNSIINSELIITDSYHCCVFAIIFNKPFVCLKNPKDYSRFESIFKIMKLNYPEIETLTDYKDYKKNNNIDYNKINTIIENLKNQNIELIKSILNEDKVTPLSQIEADKKRQEYNKTDLKINDKSYKNNRFLYLNIIEPFIEPIVRSYRMKKEAK